MRMRERDEDEYNLQAVSLQQCVPVSFRKIMPLLNRGKVAPLTIADLPPLAPGDEVETIIGKVETQVRRHSSLFIALCRAFWNDIFAAWCNGTLWVLTALAQAIILGPFVDALARNDNISAIIWGLSFIFASILTTIFLHRMFWRIMRTGFQMKVAMLGLLHNKLLKTTTAAIALAGTGKILTLATSDAVRFDNITSIFAPWFSIIAVVASYIVMFQQLEDHFAALAGVAVSIFSIIAQLWLGHSFERLRRLTASATDKRIRLTSEVIQALRIVKSMNWMKPFSQAIFDRRFEEANTIRRAQRLRALSLGVYFATIPLAALAALGTRVARSTPSKANLSVGKATSVIAVLTVCRTFLYMLARFAMNIPEIFVSCARMQQFILYADEIQNTKVKNDLNNDKVLLSTQKADFAWPSEKKSNTVRNISFTLRAGELVILSGPVGSGKSSLLWGLLDELELRSGSLQINKKCGIAISAHPPWNISGSIRENIMLGAPDLINEDAYFQAISAAALDADIAGWESGDNTLVGEKGLTLSGGQSSRLSFCRCVYAAAVGKAKLALLDDPLSAVDPTVAQRLVDSVSDILCKQYGVGVLLATHQRQFLTRADRVLVLDRDGKCLACAPLNEIIQAGGEAARLVSTDENSASSFMQQPNKKINYTRADTNIKTDTKNEARAITSKEDRTIGAVTWHTWSEFIGAGGLPIVALVFIMFILAQIALVVSDVLLLRWAGRERQRTGHSLLFRAYVGCVITASILGAMRGVLFFSATLRAANSLHTRAVRRILHVPLSWIQQNPLGRILNRFSSDLAQIDDLLSVTLLEFSTLALLMIGSILFACAALPPLIFLLPIIGYICLRIKRYVSKSMNELKRIDGITRSPVLTVFAATLDGLASIRAFSIEHAQTKKLQHCLDKNARAYFFWLACNRFLGFALDSVVVVFLIILVGLAIAMHSLVPPELPAIALIYSLQLLANCQYSVRMFALSEQFLTSVERLLSYVRLETESTYDEEDELQYEKKKNDFFSRPAFYRQQNFSHARVPMKDVEAATFEPLEWPSAGAVELIQVEYRYNIDLPVVLRGITCTFNAGTKNGVCGRTGAGKSSLLAAICRLHQVCGGRVVIDGIDVSTIPLSRLRGAIAWIPQSPTLFSGSVRFNVGLGARSDAEILAALEEAKLLTNLNPLQQRQLLDKPVDEAGSNWSSGEQQLLCLARALVLKRKICCIDEATASVDYDTDAQIQNTLREAHTFKSATLLIIAHRIRTILDSDLILVLSDGRVLEQGSPKELLQNSQSAFSSMVAASNIQQQDLQLLLQKEEGHTSVA
uniref:ATP-dependent transporter ycf16 n=1 Tax=Aureoumbra lagunensis TaxID=44058 RepID=A0A7S3NJT7_9STRA